MVKVRLKMGNKVCVKKNNNKNNNIKRIKTLKM
jgi:hypothetical protein